VPEEVALFDERLQYEGDVFDVPEFWLDGVWRNVACPRKADLRRVGIACF
jgi:hypothetical protein